MARRPRLDFPTAINLLRAIWELAVARWNLAKFDPRVLTAPGRTEDGGEVDRIAFAIRAMSARVPWRSDCLIQASAAQRWLAARGIGSTIHLGVKTSEAPIDAHAWLKVGHRIVLGGEVSDYSEFPLHRPR